MYKNKDTHMDTSSYKAAFDVLCKQMKHGPYANDIYQVVRKIGNGRPKRSCHHSLLLDTLTACLESHVCSVRQDATLT